MFFESQPNRGELAAPGRQAARLFVALKIALEIARELSRMAQVLQGPAVRLIAPADIHLTLVPPWSEISIPWAIKTLASVAAKAAPFTLLFRHLGYGPKPRFPHLLWADCEPGEELAALHASLLLAFGQTHDRAFVPHVTVAHIRGNGKKLARKHPIDHALAISQRIETVELMQSPPPAETRYRVLASLKLGTAQASL